MAGGDSVGGTALRFLVKKALERQKEEKEQRRKATEERKLEVIELLVPPLFVAALVVDNDSGMLAMLVFLLILPHALFSFRSSSGLRCSASWPSWTRRNFSRF